MLLFPPPSLFRSAPVSRLPHSLVRTRLPVTLPIMDTLRARMTSLTPFSRKHKVTVVGSGNWGSTIAKVVAENTAAHPDLFEPDVQMWVYEEQVEMSKNSKHFDESSDLCKGPQKLTTLINTFHENVKYLPNIPLPKNVVANPSITDSVKDSTILIFNLPHQFIVNLCKQLQGHILPYARGISCIKGVNVRESSISLFSETIGQELGIYCGALSGANIANEVALEKFSETTVAYDPPAMDSQNPTPATSAGPSPASSHVDLTKLVHNDSSGKPSKVKLRPLPSDYKPIDHHILKTLFHRRYFHVRVVSDVAGVSLGGALKNIVAVAAGWVDGLGWGDNAKAAIMRVGLLEMVEFGKRFFSRTVHTETFTEESAGVADLITTCAGGRNHRCAKMSVIEGKSIEEIEARELNGQKLQGTLTAYEVNTFLKSQGMEKDFPLFTAVYNILKGHAKVQDIPDLIESHSDELHNSNYEYQITSPPTILPASSQDSPPISLNAADRVSSPTQATTTSQTKPGSHKTTSPTTSISSILIPAPALASSRYNRQLLIPSISLSGQGALSRTKILVIGLGGLGSPAALYLAGCGLHTLGLVDADYVETSNLHRQIAHREDSVVQGMSKVASALRACEEINSEPNDDGQGRYLGYEIRLGSENIFDIILGKHPAKPERAQGQVVGGYDIVLDCTDNPATRYLISDACVLLGKPLISGAAQRLEGQLMILNHPSASHSTAESTSEKGPCYRCVFPRPPPPSMVQNCSEIGILGPVVGTIGVMMAGEAIRLTVQSANSPSKGVRKPNMLLYNPWSADPRSTFRTVGLRGRRKDCVVCGDDETLTEKGQERITMETLIEGRMDYEAFCGIEEDLNILGENNRIPAIQFLDKLTGSRKGDNTDALGVVVVDVREENEFALGQQVKGSINIPISKILRNGSEAFTPLVKAFASPSSEPLVSEEENTSTSAVGQEVTGVEQQEPVPRSVYFVCQRGNDSQIAAQKLIDIQLGQQGIINEPQSHWNWIGDVEGGFVAMSKIA